MTQLLPVFARLRFPQAPTLWLPVFLLWPLFALCFALSFALVVPLAMWLRAPPRQTLNVVIEAFHMLCALRGTQISVKDAYSDFDVSIY